MSFRFMEGGNNSHVSELLYKQKGVCRNIVMLETQITEHFSTLLHTQAADWSWLTEAH